jgi:hypothetical protein
MAIRYENQCCGCAAPGYPCRAPHCPNLKVPVHYCEICGEDLDDIYEVDGEELCEDCLKDMFKKGD